MNPLTAADIPDAGVFEACRDELRDRVIAHKAKRRVSVGDRVTLLFEDRETLRWQILEMCRVEGTRDAAGIQLEVDVYNDLIPGERELSATLFVEITDAEEIRPELDRLIGMDEHVVLEIGSEQVRAEFDAKQLDEERIAAVQYVRFQLSEAQAEAMRGSAESVPVRLVIDHPNYRASCDLPPDTRAALALDLEGGCGPLMDFDAVPPGVPTAPRVLITRGRVRAVLPERPASAAHVVVETIEPCGAYPELAPDLAAEMHALAQELAREMVRTHGRCRVSVDAARSPARLDVYAPPA